MSDMSIHHHALGIGITGIGLREVSRSDVSIVCGSSTGSWGAVDVNHLCPVCCSTE